MVNTKTIRLKTNNKIHRQTGLYYYGARYYNPRTSVFISVDPLAEQTMEPYLYTGNNPIMFTDPTGMSKKYIIVTKGEEKGTYVVKSGKANNDKGIYLDNGKGGKGAKVGEMLTEYSFHYEDGSAVIDAKIDLNDKSGQDFFDNKIKNIGLMDYISNAQGGELLDFKTNDMPEGLTLEQESQYHYRGMSFNGKVASARDIGNYSAGYVAGKHGQGWGASRIAFDALETKQKYRTWNVFKWRSWEIEGQPTQRAERAGHDAGCLIFEQRQLERLLQKATNPYPTGYID